MGVCAGTTVGQGEPVGGGREKGKRLFPFPTMNSTFAGGSGQDQGSKEEGLLHRGEARAHPLCTDDVRNGFEAHIPNCITPQSA